MLTRRPVQEDAPWRVNSNLLIQIKLSKRKLDRFTDFLLLRVHATNVLICHIWFFIGTKHRDGRVRLWRQDIHKSIGVAVKWGKKGGGGEVAVEGGGGAGKVGCGSGGSDKTS